jgi:hypothetical protein
MSDLREAPDPVARAAEMDPADSLKTEDSRNLPHLRGGNGGDGPSQGPNLVIVFSIMALALLAAIAAAALIVWPFYRAR